MGLFLFGLGLCVLALLPEVGVLTSPLSAEEREPTLPRVARTGPVRALYVAAFALIGAAAGVGISGSIGGAAVGAIIGSLAVAFTWIGPSLSRGMMNGSPGFQIGGVLYLIGFLVIFTAGAAAVGYGLWGRSAAIWMGVFEGLGLLVLGALVTGMSLIRWRRHVRDGGTT